MKTRFEVPTEILTAKSERYSDTPDVYEVDIDDAIPGGCMINGVFRRCGVARFEYNVSARRLVRMLLQERDEFRERISELERTARGESPA